MLVIGSAIMKPANSGRFSDNQLANAIKVPAITALNKKSIFLCLNVLINSAAFAAGILKIGLPVRMGFAIGVEFENVTLGRNAVRIERVQQQTKLL